MAKKPAKKKPRAQVKTSARGSASKASPSRKSQAKALQRKRSVAAKKGWETRRANTAKAAAASTAKPKNSKKPTKPKEGGRGQIVTPQELRWAELLHDVSEIRKKRKRPMRGRGKRYVTLSSHDGQRGFEVTVDIRLPLVEENVEEMVYKITRGAGAIESVNPNAWMYIHIFMYENGSKVGSPVVREKANDDEMGSETQPSVQGIPGHQFPNTERLVRTKLENMLDQMLVAGGAIYVDVATIRSFEPRDEQD